MDLPFDPDSLEILDDCLASTVYRGRSSSEDTPYKWVVIKRAPTSKKACREPHDILKESNMLAALRHDNVVAFLGSHTSHKKGLHEFWMPFIPMSFQVLISSPYFSPFAMPSTADFYDKSTSFRNGVEQAQFAALAKSIFYQVLSALVYLHDDLRQIAHRDIKPSNILLTDTGCVKLIDFGIAYTPSPGEAKHTIWPEPPDRMYCEVATGPYRAPELLFGPSTYDARTTDMWSLGVCLAHCFTSLEQVFDDEEEDEQDSRSEDEEETSGEPLQPFILPKFSYGSILRPSRWVRRPLLDADRGELGLIWSIFSTFGTPTHGNWPTFDELPHASRVNFRVVKPKSMTTLLPNLPSKDSLGVHPLDLLQKFLVYPSTQRLRASDALNHPWFTTSALVLPLEYCLPSAAVNVQVVEVWEGNDLGTWLRETISGSSEK